MKVVIASSKDVFPNRDNPTGRMDFPYLAMLSAATKADYSEALGMVLLAGERGSMPSANDLQKGIYKATAASDRTSAIYRKLGLRNPTKRMIDFIAAAVKQSYEIELAQVQQAIVDAQARVKELEANKPK